MERLRTVRIRKEAWSCTGTAWARRGARLWPPGVAGFPDVSFRVDRRWKPAVVHEIELHGDLGDVTVVNEASEVIEELHVGPLLHALSHPVALGRNAQGMRNQNLDIHQVDRGVLAQLGEGAAH